MASPKLYRSDDITARQVRRVVSGIRDRLVQQTYDELPPARVRLGLCDDCPQVLICGPTACQRGRDT